MTPVINGALPAAALVTVPGTRELLAPGAAAAWIAARDQVRAQYGWTPTLTDGYRPLAEQEKVFRERYTTAGPTSVDRVGRAWLGRRWYRHPGCATAAVPGTSHHGLAIAADVGGLGDRGSTRWTQWATVAVPLGWSHAEGDSIGEPWHWVRLDTPDDDTPRPAPTPPAPAPAVATPPNLEDTMIVYRFADQVWLRDGLSLRRLTDPSQIVVARATASHDIEVDALGLAAARQLAEAAIVDTRSNLGLSR